MLNRPEKRNAISYELIDDVLRALAEVESSSAKSYCYGCRKAFCSGMDLGNLRSITGRTPEENQSDSASMGPSVPHHIRVPSHDRRRQWAGSRRWLRSGDLVRLHAGLHGS